MTLPVVARKIKKSYSHLNLISYIESAMNNRVQARQSSIRATTVAYSHRHGFSAYLESDLEVDYFNLRSYEDNYVYFKMQPEPIFYFQANQKQYRYTPDAECIDSSGLFYVDEVKYQAEAEKEKNKSKFLHIEKIYAQKGKIFRVVTEKQIRQGNRAENLRYLAPTWALPSPVEELSLFLEKLKYYSAPIQRLGADMLKDNQAPCLIRRALGHRLLKCDITQPWTELYLYW